MHLAPQPLGARQQTSPGGGAFTRLPGSFHGHRCAAHLGSFIPQLAAAAGDRGTLANGLAADSLALCDQITCLLVSLLGESFGQLDQGLLAQLRQRGALALGLMPSDLRPGG